MTQTAKIKAIALYELGTPIEAVKETEELLKGNNKLYSVLCNPVITKEEKHKVIDKIFPKEVRNFLKLMCDMNSADELFSDIDAYYEYWNEKHNILIADVYYAKELPEELRNRIFKFLDTKYVKPEIKLIPHRDDTLIGGFKVVIGNDVYDQSYDGMLNQLRFKLSRR